MSARITIWLDAETYDDLRQALHNLIDRYEADKKAAAMGGSESMANTWEECETRVREVLCRLEEAG